jgi:hypothetical protein
MLAAVNALSEPEQAAMLGALIKMIRTLQEAGQIPTSRMCITCQHFEPRAHTGDRPHHCHFVDAPLADADLRIDCTDHDEAPAERRDAVWRRLTTR